MNLTASNLQDYVVKKIISYLEDPELIALKKRLEQEKKEKSIYFKEKKRKVEEWNDHYEFNHKNEYIPLIDEYPDYCKECKTVNLYKDAYTDDIDIVCGICNHTAGYLPGYGYNPITCKKLKESEKKEIIARRKQFYYDQIAGEKPPLSRLPDSCPHCECQVYLMESYCDEDGFYCRACDELINLIK